ncbi:hypothetical protein C8R47DRAFT_1324091 [Mycena vitilis]|nr:hypothetical protein C8R47DRAFT_1324091 [Mycena vitilis]
MTYLWKWRQGRGHGQGIVTLVLQTNAFSAAVALIGLFLYSGNNQAYCAPPICMLSIIYANTLLPTLNDRAVIKRPDGDRKSETSCVPASSEAIASVSGRPDNRAARMESGCGSGPISFAKPVVDEYINIVAIRRVNYLL